MKRPLVWLGISVLTGVFLWVLGLPALVTLSICLITIPLCNFKTSSRKLMLVVLSISLCVMIYAGVVDHRYQKTMAEVNQSRVVEGYGIIAQVKTVEAGYHYVLKPWFIDGVQQKKFKIVLYANEPFLPGDQVNFSGDLIMLHSGANEGSFNLSQTYKEKGVVAVLQGHVELDYVTKAYRLQRLLQDARTRHMGVLRGLLPEQEGSIVGNMVLGIKNVEDETIEAYQRVGVIHILAISGLHISLIGFMLFNVLEKIWPNQRLNSWIVVVMLGAYCIYTGGQISTVRATIMMTVYFGHKMVYRHYDQHIALAIAIILSLIYNPLQITSPGFLLSFGAVISIFYITPRLPFKDVSYPVVHLFRVMLAIQLGLAPMLVYFYYRLPTYSFFANLLIIPVVAFIVGIGFPSILLGSMVPALGKWLVGSVYFLVHYVDEVVRVLNALPYNSLLIGHITVFELMVCYGVMMLWLLKSYRKWGYILMSLFLLYGIASYGIDMNRFELDMLDVGNGDALFCHYQNQTYLFDGGGQVGLEGNNVGLKILKPYLAYNGKNRIDYVIMSHSDFDHSYGIFELIGQVDIGGIMMPATYKNWEDPYLMALVDQAKAYGVKIYYIGAGDTLQNLDLTINFLYPMVEKRYKDNNRNSVASLLSMDDFDILLMGDLTIEDERELLKVPSMSLGEVEVLKVGHHGSKTSSGSEFLEVVQPVISLISVGQNNLYGHPEPVTLERLLQASDHLYMTKDGGQINLIYNHKDIKVTPYREDF